MRLLAAFDKFKDSFSATEACSLLHEVAQEQPEKLEVISCPLTDGGEGFVNILTNQYEGEFLEVEARDSLGMLKQTKIGWLPIERLSEEVCLLLQVPRKGNLAILEMASVCGLSDLPNDQRNPWHTSTVGVGDLLRFARDQGADAILLGIGGSSTNDAGLGALSVLGLEVLSSLGEKIGHPCPKTWKDLSINADPKIKHLPPIIIACDVDNPLLGNDGATHQFGPQKGLQVDDIPVLELKMSTLVSQLSKVFPKASELSLSPGAGAAGGIGFGLSLAGNTRLVSGFELVSKWLNLEEQIRSADVIFTGEGRFDSTSLRGKGPNEVLVQADKYNKKSYLMCGSLEDEIKSNLAVSFPKTTSIAFGNPSWSLEKNLRGGSESLRNHLRQVLNQWTTEDFLECPVTREARFKRIRRLKKFLRPLPRRSNVHRYPVLKWFSETAYKKSFLWSFRSKPIQSALFWGIWISLLPIVGIQMLVVFFVSLLVRANLPVIVALQWISNPLTMGPIYFADYKVGMTLLKLLGVDYPKNKLLSPEYDWAHFSYKELIRLLDTFPPMFIGGSVLGVFFAVVTVFLYKLVSKFYKK